MLCAAGFVDDGMFLYNAGNTPESKTTTYVLSSAPGSGTGGEVCCL